MAEISIGAAVGEGFNLIRSRPGVVISWGLVQLAVSLIGFLIMGPLLASVYWPIIKAAMAGAPPGSMPFNASNATRMEGLIYLFDLVSVFASSVIYCAVFRAVLHPERSQFAYLRVGAPELFLFLLIVGAYIAVLIGMVVAMIPVGIVVAILFGVHAGAVGALVGVAAAVAIVVALVILSLRVSLVGPMMVDDGQFHLTEVWALTRGKVASLFGMALLVFLILLAAELVLGLAALALGFGVLGALAGGLSHLPAFFQQSPAQFLPRLVPLLIVGVLISIPFMGCLLAIMGAPWARAYRDLRPLRDAAETFA